MVQGYYTLEEAARILGMGSEDLSQMAQRREVRAFADRGTWRFRTQDIEELARRKGLGSNPDLQLGEAPVRKQDTPRREPEGRDAGVFNFALSDSSDQVEIGQEIFSETPSGAAKAGSKADPKSGPKSGPRSGPRSGPKSPPPKSPTPKPGSDSDVRLVADGSDVTFQIAPDSDVKVTEPSPKSSVRRKGPQPDSGVRLVPMESEADSDVKIVPDSKDQINTLGGQPPKSGTDSDIRVESEAGGGRRPSELKSEDSFLTEEIDLDAELRAAEEAAQAKKSSKMKRDPTPPGGAAAFELSESELDPAKAAPAKGSAKGSPESSSDFDLSIDSGSSIELDSGELAKRKEEEVSLGDMPARGVTGGHDSGINLQEPADSGISLEQGGDSSDEIEFELSLDAESTPKPAKADKKATDSSSEFELTLEDSAKLAPLEEEKPAAAEEDKDIFETDFEVPALEDESGSQVAALDESDTDLESSDFDLALGEEDMAGEEESGSQVVALDDEGEVDEGAATVAKPRKKGAAVAEDEEVADELLDEGELEEEEEGAPVRRVAAVAAQPADWGIFAPVTLLISTFILFFVGLMSIELLHGMWGYRQPYKVPSMVIKGVGGMLGFKDVDKE
ncbi:MAG TPA: helix-turn-helix domain-containing protein [Gemmataceae bacterium]|nr:helix-turn-helix domain-containing protein [Gemmataceae bacterium]